MFFSQNKEKKQLRESRRLRYSGTGKHQFLMMMLFPSPGTASFIYDLATISLLHFEMFPSPKKKPWLAQNKTHCHGWERSLLLTSLVRNDHITRETEFSCEERLVSEENFRLSLAETSHNSQPGTS